MSDFPRVDAYLAAREAGQAEEASAIVNEVLARFNTRTTDGSEAAALLRANLTGSADEQEASCHRCGCTEDRACPGGCYWVVNDQGVDLCSACA